MGAALPSKAGCAARLLPPSALKRGLIRGAHHAPAHGVGVPALEQPSRAEQDSPHCLRGVEAQERPPEAMRRWNGSLPSCHNH